MTDDEIRLDGWGRVFLLRRWAVRQRASSDLGPVELRRGSDVTVVPGHCVRRVSEADAWSLAGRLLDNPGGSFALSRLIEGLRMGGAWTREQSRRGLARALTDFVLVTLEDERGRWDGPAVRPKLNDALETSIERPSPLTWVGVTVVDDEDPARPLSGAKFQLRLPDATNIAGALDGDGHLRVDDVEPGKCWLDLTDIARKWAP